MREIDISKSVGLGLIIKYQTGTIFNNQTGGTACYQMSQEGIYMPLFSDYEIPSRKFISGEIELNEYFLSEKYLGTGATNGIDDDDAERVDSILRKNFMPFIRVDREKISKSHEAWIWVKIENDSVFLNFPKEEFPLSGVLTWSNSD